MTFCGGRKKGNGFSALTADEELGRLTGRPAAAAAAANWKGLPGMKKGEGEGNVGFAGLNMSPFGSDLKYFKKQS